jgi:pimeloyl-ACP methyl ester carboxylesterase
MGTAPQPQPYRSRRPHPAWLLLLLLLLTPLLYSLVNRHLRAASLLLRIQNANDHSWLSRYSTYSVVESTGSFIAPAGTIRARTYSPLAMVNAPGIVVVHGVHHLGIEEPRLIAFSRALAQAGFQVFTPELPGIADYHIDAGDIDVIGDAALEFSRRTSQPVGVMGLSFAGGLSLLAAADPRFSRSIAYVVSVGGHDDMQRVAEFFISGQIARPDGTVIKLKPHEYGALVLMYSHLDEFFSADEASQVHDCFRLLLWEQIADSRQAEAKLLPATRKKFDPLFDHDSQAFAPALSVAIKRHQVEMAGVSPHDHLAGLHAPVLLLHGMGDDVIPASEMLWLEKDVPPRNLRGALATPLLSHVSIAGEPPWQDKVALVRFMATLFSLADESQTQRLPG